MSSRTRSSSNSASALNLFTNPFRPSDPLLPSETRGFSFDPSIVSRKTMRGYAIGIPNFQRKNTCQGTKCREQTKLHNQMFYAGGYCVQSLKYFLVLSRTAHLV